MAAEHDTEGPAWWVPPGETDTFAIVALVFLALVIFSVIHLYARFDRYAEHRSADTPLRTTVPTLLTVALAYEAFPPLSHFSVLLPIALIAVALARDFMLWQQDRAMPGTPLGPDSPRTDPAGARPEANNTPGAAVQDTPARHGDRPS